MDHPTDPEARREQALKQARRIVGMAQATMALEGQAVSEVVFERAVQLSAERLLAGPDEMLWGEP